MRSQNFFLPDMKLPVPDFIFLLLLVLTQGTSGQNAVSNLRLPEPGEKVFLHSGWYAHDRKSLSLDGEAVSEGNFPLDNWYPATVPGTILTTLVNNGLFPDPVIGTNNDKIPDIFNTGNEYYTYWFVNCFIPEKSEAGRHYRINFRGINYKAEIFLNGRKLNPMTHESMFLRESYDITGMLQADQPNTLAVLVFPPDPCGNPNGGQGGDGAIGRCITAQYTAGWDWISAVRDRNTGIWDQVSVSCSGDVRITDPYISSSVPGIRVPGEKQEDAFVSVSTSLENTSGKTIRGRLVCNLGGQTVRKELSLGPHEMAQPQFPRIRIINPRLWWPNGFGSPELYDLKMEFIQENGSVSDRAEMKIGIRKITSALDTTTHSRLFKVNGQKIFLRGGNWIASDWMLRTSTERYDAEVRLHKEMNLNMIRIWGGSVTERPEFYEACDKYGLLVMQDLFVTGDCNGAWNDSLKKDSRTIRRKYPDNHSLFISTVIDQVKMLRNHPSLMFWCGGNEFHPATDIDSILKARIFPVYDPGRVYVNSSFSRELTLKLPELAGDGPYEIEEPEWFYFPQANPFNPEMGSIGLPETETLEKILPASEWIPPTDMTRLPGWSYHRFLGYGDQVERYGSYTSLEEYNRQAQLVNYQQYKSFLEGRTSHMFKCYTGVVIWRTQNPWTALGGQMYDYYLAQNGCFFGLQSACEPVHIQLNLDDSTLAVANTSPLDLKDGSYQGIMYSPEGVEVNRFEGTVSAGAQAVTEIMKLPRVRDCNNLYFLKLRLNEHSGVKVSENFYWMNQKGKDFSALRRLPKATPEIRVQAGLNGNTEKLVVTIQNPASVIAFFIHLQLKDRISGERILPAFYSDNYLSLVPGESKVVIIEFKLKPGCKPQLSAEGWNTDRILREIPE